MNREVLDKWCARGIFALTLAVLVFGPLATGAVRTPDFLVIQSLTLGILFLWMARLWLLPKPRLLWPPVCWAVVAFTLYAVGRYLKADIEYVARQELIRVLVYASLFFAILNNLHRQEFIQIIVLTLVFLAMGIAGYANFQFFTGANKVWNFNGLYGHRGTGTFISPNNCAGFLEMILPLALAWVLVGRSRHTLKVFITYAALVIVCGIAVTVSRGGWISTSVSLLIFFGVLLFNRTYRLPSLVALAFILGGVIFFAPKSYYFKARLNAINKDNKLNSSARFDLWLPAVEMWRENPWWGVGPAHYDYRFREWRPMTEQKQPYRAHNDYLNTLADWGIVGVALVTSAWVLLGAGVVKTWKYVGAQSDLGGRNSNKFALLLGATIGLVAILIHSVVDFNMHIPANAILVITLMALLSSSLRFASERYWFTLRIFFKIAATFCIGAGLIYLGLQENRRVQEYYWRQQAQLQPENSPERVADLEKAFAIEPMNPATVFDLGEAFRRQSWDGNEDYVDLARQAIKWFDLGEKLNPYDGYNYLKTGMCLDWIHQSEKADSFFEHAIKLDPNGYFTTAYVGWHYLQLKDYAAAKVCFNRSLHLDWESHVLPESYLDLCNRKLREIAASTNQSPPLLSP